MKLRRRVVAMLVAPIMMVAMFLAAPAAHADLDSGQHGNTQIPVAGMSCFAWIQIVWKTAEDGGRNAFVAGGCDDPVNGDHLDYDYTRLWVDPAGSQGWTLIYMSPHQAFSYNYWYGIVNIHPPNDHQGARWKWTLWMGTIADHVAWETPVVGPV